MEGRKSVSGNLFRGQPFQVPDTTSSKDESPARSIDLNRPLYDEEAIKARFDCIMLQDNRPSSVGPIKKRYVVRAESSCQSSNVRIKDLPTDFLGLRFIRSRNVYADIWTRINEEMMKPLPILFSKSSGSLGVSQGERTTVEFEGPRNSLRFRETMEEGNKRCDRRRHHPYARPNSPQPKPYENISTPSVSIHSCVDSCNEGDVDHEVHSHVQHEDGAMQPAQVPRQLPVQNFSVRQQPNHNSMDYRCKFCLGETIRQEAYNQSLCGHFYHMGCLMLSNRPRDDSFCFHCAWTCLHQN